MTAFSHRPDPVVRLVDDDQSVLKALGTYLDVAGFRVAAYDSAARFLGEDDFNVPGCLVLDVRMPRMTGIELQHEMKVRGIDLPIIFLSAHGDIAMAVDAVKAGAKTFLVKPPKLDELAETIAEAIEENVERRAKVRDWLELRADFEKLTPAEKAVAGMIVKGLTNAVIAEALGMAERTVKAHRAAVYEKLDVENAVELADFLHELDDYRKELESK